MRGWRNTAEIVQFDISNSMKPSVFHAYTSTLSPVFFLFSLHLDEVSNRIPPTSQRTTQVLHLHDAGKLDDARHPHLRRQRQHDQLLRKGRGGGRRAARGETANTYMGILYYNFTNYDFKQTLEFRKTTLNSTVLATCLDNNQYIV